MECMVQFIIALMQPGYVRRRNGPAISAIRQTKPERILSSKQCSRVSKVSSHSQAICSHLPDQIPADSAVHARVQEGCMELLLTKITSSNVPTG
jgi:hypothetical protein